MIHIDLGERAWIHTGFAMIAIGHREYVKIDCPNSESSTLVYDDICCRSSQDVIRSECLNVVDNVQSLHDFA